MTTSGQEGRGRPRRPETDRRIMAAALGLLREEGPAGLTIDAVAARSGVARSTVYRRYRDRRELVGAALDELVPDVFPSPELPAADKVRWVLQRVQDLLEHGLGAGGTAALLTDADPGFTTALRRRIEDRVGTLRELVATDVDRGRMGPHVDADTLVGVLFGAYLGEVVRHGRPRQGWADRVIDLLLRGLR